MKLLFALLVLATPTVVLYYWFGGLIGGFRLWSKLPPWLRRWWRRYALLTWLMTAGGAAVGGIVVERGCVSLPQLAAAYVVPTNPAKFHSLGKVEASHDLPPIPFKILHRLHLEDAKRERERQQQETIRLHNDATIATNVFFVDHPLDKVTINTDKRKPPFCHVTCYGHHGGIYDRETLPEYCKANWIPKTEWTPGWYHMPGTNEDWTTAWPGPTSTGFEKYVLYWSQTNEIPGIKHASPDGQ